MSRLSGVLLVFLLASTADAQSLRDRMLYAEDQRGDTAESLAPLRDGLRSRVPETRRQAIRSLGRFERPALIPDLARLLEDQDATVRRELFTALGQLAQGADAVRQVFAQVSAAMAIEPDADAWGAAAITIGRLAYTDAAQVAQAERLLVAGLPPAADQATGDRGRQPPARAARPAAMVGAARGLESLARISRTVAPLSPATLERLRVATRFDDAAAAEAAARVRRLAWLALTPNGVTDDVLQAGGRDADEEVRRLVMAAAGASAALPASAAVIERGLSDANGRVRYEALRGWGRRTPRTSCAPAVTAVADRDPHVQLLAIDLLGDGCPDGAGTRPVAALAETITPLPSAWHAPAHALVALARLDPALARGMLPRYLDHRIWQVRMYAARAAIALGAADALEDLARDEHDNVREAALVGMNETKHPSLMAMAVESIASRRDYQLLRTAARILAKGAATAPPTALTEVLDALERVTAEGRETSRDARTALLEAVQALAPAAAPEARAGLQRTLTARLSDFDPQIASRAATLLETITGAPRTATPVPRPRPALAFERLEAGPLSLRVTIAGKGSFALRLFTDEAPLTALRVLALASDKYYDGLTFHRVAANFVIQGGSPGANEYVGDGPFMRDEVGERSHARGTVGISTRGRDTGDAQLFVNLVDSPRLDHAYTVMAEVVDGMEVVDAVVEGDTIQSITVVPAGRP